MGSLCLISPSPNCPFGDSIVQEVHDTVHDLSIFMGSPSGTRLLGEMDSIWSCSEFGCEAAGVFNEESRDNSNPAFDSSRIQASDKLLSDRVTY